MVKRCSWANSSELLRKHHDEKWGKPLYDDQKLFEAMILESKSCGLSWELILKKREYITKAFDNFDPETLVKYDNAKIEALMRDTGIIRHRAKIEAVIENAKAYLTLKRNGSFSDFLWQYVDYKPIVNDGKHIITKNEISNKLSKDLKKLGFKFIGSVSVYAFMQDVGMVNDHAADCFAKYLT